MAPVAPVADATAGTPPGGLALAGWDDSGPAPTAEVPQPASAGPASTHAHATIALLRTGLMRGRLAWASAAQSRYPGRMPDEVTAVEVRPHLRLLHGMRRPANWLQLVRFGLVGGLGFAVNLAVYALLRACPRRSTTTSRQWPPGSWR